MREELSNTFGISRSDQIILFRTIRSLCDSTIQVMQDQENEVAIAQIGEVETVGTGEDSKKEVIHVPKIEPIVSVPFVGTHEYLERFQLIKQYNWSSSIAMPTPLNIATELIFPGNFFSNNTGILPRLKSAIYTTPDVEILIKCCGSDSLSGRLIIPIFPLPNILNPAYRNFWTCTGGEYYELDAGENTSVSFTVPYRSIVDRMDLTANSSQNIRNLFALMLYVAVPVQGFQTSTDTCSVTVYARLVNPRLIGSTNTAPIAQMADAEPIERTKEGITLSGASAKIADCLTKISSVPGIGGFVSPVAASANSLSDFFKYLGFDIPNNVASVTPVQNRGVLFNRICDNPSSVILGLDQSGALPKDSRFVFDEPDATSIVKIGQRPFLTYIGEINNSTTVSSVIWDWWVSPCNIIADTYSRNASYSTLTANSGGTGNLYTYYPSPISNILTMVNMWSGSIRVRLSFVGHRFQRCSIRVVWDPAQNYTALANTSAFAEPFSKVYDLSGSQDIYFCIPYVADTQWLSTRQPFIINSRQTIPGAPTNGNGWALGRLTIYTETLLNGGNASVPPYGFLAYVSVGKDFRIASPSFDNLAETGRPIAQIGSYKDFTEMEYPPFVGDGTTQIIHNATTPYEITSLKQLASMATIAFTNPMDTGNYISQLTTSANSSFIITPYGSYDFYKSATPASHGNVRLRANYFRRVLSMFCFYRGGIRYTLHPLVSQGDRFPVIAAPSNTNASLVTYSAMLQDHFAVQTILNRAEGSANARAMFTASAVSAGAINVNPYTTSQVPEAVDISSGYHYFNNIENSPIDVVVPYSSLFICQHNSMHPLSVLNDSPLLFFTMPLYKVCPWALMPTNPAASPLKFEQSASTPSAYATYFNNATVAFGTNTFTTTNQQLMIVHGIKFILTESAYDDFMFGLLLPALPMQFAVNSTNFVTANRRRRSVNEGIDIDGLSADVINEEIMHEIQSEKLPTKSTSTIPKPLIIKTTTFSTFMNRFVPKNFRKKGKRVITPSEQEIMYDKFIKGLDVPKEYSTIFSTPADSKSIPF